MLAQLAGIQKHSLKWGMLLQLPWGSAVWHNYLPRGHVKHYSANTDGGGHERNLQWDRMEKRNVIFLYMLTRPCEIYGAISIQLCCKVDEKHFIFTDHVIFQIVKEQNSSKHVIPGGADDASFH